METLLRKKYFLLAIFVLNLIIIGIECKNNNNKDSSTDICFKNPCYNGGKCSQTHISPGYKCACSGTGYSGNRCQNKCPSLSGSVGSNGKQTAKQPPECIVI